MFAKFKNDSLMLQSRLNTQALVQSLLQERHAEMLNHQQISHVRWIIADKMQTIRNDLHLKSTFLQVQALSGAVPSA